MNLKDCTVFRQLVVLLATGVDNMTISNIKVDTNHDGFDMIVAATSVFRLHGEFSSGRCDLPEKFNGSVT
jgi:hypothetical protein